MSHIELLEPDQLIRNAMTSISEGEYETALGMLAEVIRLGQCPPGLETMRSFCLMRMGQLGQARVAAERELAANPGHSEAQAILETLDGIAAQAEEEETERQLRLTQPPLSAFYIPGEGSVPFFYIVTYPRSGTTWMLQSLTTLYDGQEAELNSSSYTKHMIPLYDGNYIGFLNPVIVGKPAAIKTHDNRSEFLDAAIPSKVIYVHRDGRDAITSFYHFKQSRIWGRPKKDVHFDPEEFAEELEKDAPGWRDHLLGWMETENLTMVRYEDMKADYLKQISRIAATLRLEQSVTLQDLKVKFVDQFKPNGDFFRKGIVGDWENHWDERHKDIFKKHAGDLMIRLGYVENNDW